jgi:hypothetical protein
MQDADARITKAEKAAEEKIGSIFKWLQGLAAVAGVVTVGGVVTIAQSISSQAEQAGLSRIREAATQAERHRDGARDVLDHLRSTIEQRANDAGLALIGTLRQEAERRLAEIRQFQEDAFAPGRSIIIDHGTVRINNPNLDIALREPRPRGYQVTVPFAAPVQQVENVCILLSETANVEIMPVHGGEAGRQISLSIGAVRTSDFRIDIVVGAGDAFGRNGVFRLDLGWVAFRRTGRSPCPA